MPSGNLISMQELALLAERLETAYSGFPHIDEEVALLAEQTKLMCIEHTELLRQMQSIVEAPMQEAQGKGEQYD